MDIALITLTALIAAAIDAKQMDAHRLQVRRLYRKIKKVERANQLTALDALYYRSLTSK